MRIYVSELTEDGYAMIFGLLKRIGRLVCAGFFMVQKNPWSVIPLFVYPVLMTVFLNHRQPQSLALRRACKKADRETIGMISSASKHNQLIADFHLRPDVVDAFHEELLMQQKPEKALNMFTFHSELLVPWIASVSVVVYIILGASEVIAGSLSIGAFITT